MWYFQKPVYSGIMLFFVVVPLGILWLKLDEPALGIAACVLALVSLALVPVDARRGAFEAHWGIHPDSGRPRNFVFGAVAAIALVAFLFVFLSAG